MLPFQASPIALLEQNGPFCNTFCINMVMVWNILYEMFGQMPAWLHAAQPRRRRMAASCIISCLPTILAVIT